MLPYFRNYCGASLTEEEYQDVKHPYVELYTHVTLKTVQAGTTLGSVVFGPLIALVKKDSRNIKGLSRTISKAGTIGAGIGLIAGPVMVYNRIKNQPEVAVYDRSYRLRKNRTQVQSDQGYVIGGVVGLAVSAIIRASPVTCSLVGMSTGLIGVGVYNNLIKTSP